MATAYTSVRQHVLNALSAGISYEKGQTLLAAQQKQSDQMKARLVRVSTLVRASQRVSAMKENL